LAAVAYGGVTPVVVSDQTSLAILGMDGRQFRTFIEQHTIPHRVWKRHVFVSLDRVLQALGLSSEPAVAPPTGEREQSWDEATVIQLAARPRKAGAS